MREEMRTFGYLCPQCGKPVLKSRSVFALEASGAEVDCGCGGCARPAGTMVYSTGARSRPLRFRRSGCWRGPEPP